MSSTVFDAASPQYSASELLAGRVEVDFIDVNGDGLPDRVVAIGDVISGTAHWYVDYNTGKGFAQVSNGSLAGGEFQDGLPVLGPWVSTPDIAFVDLNRDGRPDFVARYDVNGMTNFQNTSCASGASDNLMVWSNSAAGLEGSSAYVDVPCWPNIIGRQGFRPYQNYLQGPPGDHSIAAAYNEGFYDIDGDGIMDYMRAPDASEGFAANTWLMYRGVNQTRRSDILTSMTTATGLNQVLHWSPSTAFGAKSGLASVSDVVAAIDQSGPAMSPMATSVVRAS